VHCAPAARNAVVIGTVVVMLVLLVAVVVDVGGEVVAIVAILVNAVVSRATSGTTTSTKGAARLGLGSAVAPSARSRHRQYVSVRGLIRSRAANAAAVNPLLVHRATRAAHVARVSRPIGGAGVLRSTARVSDALHRTDTKHC
jgi:hypothetical protein